MANCESALTPERDKDGEMLDASLRKQNEEDNLDRVSQARENYS